jgi:uncharacterized repeat protein (TIGR04076 family)
MSDRDDTFELYDLRVEVVATDRPMVCGHRSGDWLELRGENLTLPAGHPFSIYALAALIPFFRRSSASRPTTGSQPTPTSPVPTPTAAQGSASRGLAHAHFDTATSSRTAAAG